MPSLLHVVIRQLCNKGSNLIARRAEATSTMAHCYFLPVFYMALTVQSIALRLHWIHYWESALSWISDSDVAVPSIIRNCTVYCKGLCGIHKGPLALQLTWARSPRGRWPWLKLMAGGKDTRVFIRQWHSNVHRHLSWWRSILTVHY